MLILGFVALFLLGSKNAGSLENLDHTKRFILAIFIALTGSLLIIIGVRNKVKGGLISLILGGSLAAMPFIFPTQLTANNSTSNTQAIDSTPSTLTDEITESNGFAERLEEYKSGIGFEIIEKLRKESPPERIKAIILLENKIQYLDSILPYLEYNLNLSSAPVTYTYGREIDGKPVTLLTMSSDTSFDELFELTKKFGEPLEMNDIRSTLKVIEVKVNQEALTPPPEGVSTDPLHPEYFNINYLELESIDRVRQLDAAKRLQSGEYLGRQSDISKLLASLLSTKDHELSSQCIATLNNWTRPEYKTDEQVLKYAKEIMGTTHMTRSVMDYLVDKKVPGATEIFAKQWQTSRGGLLWASYLIQANSMGEEAIIQSLPKVGDSHYKSAASILNKVGTSRSIPSLNNAISKANTENKKYLKAVIDEIKSRQ